MNTMENHPADQVMHPAVKDMIEHFGVTDQCREFLSQKQILYIDGKFTPGQGSDRLPVLEPSTGQFLTTVTSATTGDADNAVAAARRAGVRCALSTDPVPVTPRQGEFRWGRITPRPADTGLSLATKLDPWHAEARSLWRRLRYAREWTE